MGLEGILLYSARAMRFALWVSAAYVLIRSIHLAVFQRGAPIRWGREALWLASVAYLAALYQITVIRSGIDWARAARATRTVQWIPLKTTLGQLEGGAWAFAYHLAGNAGWFIPLGALLGRRALWMSALAGFLVSCSIEALQYLLASGVTDVDDVLINALGAVIGCALVRGADALNRRRRAA